MTAIRSKRSSTNVKKRERVSMCKLHATGGKRNKVSDSKINNAGWGTAKQ